MLHCLLLWYSDFVWKLTRDASEDPPLEIVQEWIKQISDAIGVVIHCTDYVKRILVNRAKYLRRKCKQQAGGRQRRHICALDWVMKLPMSALVLPTNIIEENDELKQLTQLQEEKLHAASNLIERLQSGTEHIRGRRKRTAKHYSKRHEQRLKKARAETCAAALTWLEAEGLTPLKVVVHSSVTDTVETIALQQDIGSALGVNHDTISEDDVDTVSMMLFIKDRFDVSGRAYHEMAKICKSMPRHYQIKRKIAELNCLWNIRPTPNGIIGVQQSLEERLLSRVQHLHRVTPPDAAFKEQKTIRVKLAGDGTTIGKRLHVVNFTYTLLDEGDLAHSHEGNHCLAIFRAPENYESLKNALADIISEVSRLDYITVNGEQYKIDYYMGGDWKYLAIVTGT